MSVTVVLTDAGRVNTSPATLFNNLTTTVAATNPGYTYNLPGSLVADIAGTDVAALAVCDSAVTELINSVTPYGANAFILAQLGAVYGVPMGAGSTTSVYVVFSGPPGFPIPKGFTVYDSISQYVVQDGGIINSAGTTIPLYALAVTQGIWAVTANSVTNIFTSVPSSIGLTVTNPLPGIPGTTAQTEGQYRSQVLQAGLVGCQGTPAYLRTLLECISGVQSQLIAIQPTNGAWKIIVGGGDAYEVGYAIYRAVPDVGMLVGSSIEISSITTANPGVVTTTLNHGYVTGQTISFQNVGGMLELNSGTYTATVLSGTSFSIGVDTTSYLPFTEGGEVLPNERNVVVSINNYPDYYNIPFVNPPQQSVGVLLVWNTTAVNFIAVSQFSQIATQAIVGYVNALPVGAPINVFEMERTVQEAAASVLPSALLSRMVWSVTINGVATAPAAGTQLISGDPESYFYATTATIVVEQG